MRWLFVFLIVVSSLLVSCSVSDSSLDINGGIETYGPGEEFVTYIYSEEIGNIVVQISLPETARYEDGAPMVIITNTFFTPTSSFDTESWAQDQGFIKISYLWPGTSDVRTGFSSEGENDYGGELSLRAFRDVILFSLGQIPNANGNYITDLISSEVMPLTDNVGLYAFSHPGIAATNILALYPEELADVKYLVGRENPTIDKLSSVEVGQYQDPDAGVKVKLLSPSYTYPDNYSPFNLEIDYSNINYDLELGLPFFDLNEDGVYDEDDFLFGDRIPQMFGKKYYSVDLTTALLRNGALTASSWPEDLATMAEVQRDWPLRETVENYPLLLGSSLKVMLVFAKDDHVQVAADKPHIHQAFDGFFSGAKLWVRLNPDLSYVNDISFREVLDYPDNDANSEPSDWLDIESWSYEDFRGAANVVSAAAISEMADRTRYNVWDDNLDSTIN